jgi:hypothetical protein
MSSQENGIKMRMFVYAWLPFQSALLALLLIFMLFCIRKLKQRLHSVERYARFYQLRIT